MFLQSFTEPCLVMFFVAAAFSPAVAVLLIICHFLCNFSKGFGLVRCRTMLLASATTLVGDGAFAHAVAAAAGAVAASAVSFKNVMGSVVSSPLRR